MASRRDSNRDKSKSKSDKPEREESTPSKPEKQTKLDALVTYIHKDGIHSQNDDGFAMGRYLKTN